jgi:hypothetical protein
MDNRPKTIFIDIDGTLVLHNPPGSTSHVDYRMITFPGTIQKLNEWDAKGYNIILTTGRRESMREVTEKQLREVGIFYDQLIMGIGGGPRILINDKKPGGDLAAFSINIDRNYGIKDLDI